MGGAAPVGSRGRTLLGGKRQKPLFRESRRLAEFQAEKPVQVWMKAVGL